MFMNWKPEFFFFLQAEAILLSKLGRVSEIHLEESSCRQLHKRQVQED